MTGIKITDTTMRDGHQSLLATRMRTEDMLPIASEMDAAANIVFRRDIEAAGDPEAKRKELIEDYRRNFANPYIAASRGFIDDVIDPRDTRPRLIDALRLLRTKRDANPRKKHGCIPL